jgi:hypothetical protein
MSFIHNPTGADIAGNATASIIVPDSQQYELKYGHVIMTTDATVANRYLSVSILNESGSEIMSTHSGAPVTASATGQHHELMQGIYRETAFINGAVQVPIPIGFVIPAGYTLQLSIDNGVAGDSLDYALMFEVENVVPGESVI